MDPSPRSPISHSSSSGCVNLGRSSSTSFPYFQNWKFYYSSNLRPKGIFSEDQAWIYTAEIVSAISHLHKSGIVHRDLEPENIRMDVDGHVMTTMPST